ncbi:MAG: potassium transporter Kup [Solirubrobacteraceae bacterium]
MTEPGEQPATSGGRRSLNEAAHKLTTQDGARPARGERPPPEGARWAFHADRDVVSHSSRGVLALGALGVVFGDLGTSPLYTEQVIFTQHARAVHATPAGVYGVASLVFWSLVIIASAKYAVVIMRIHNDGDGGVMALTGLVRRRGLQHAIGLMVLGTLGAGLFLGDGMITPALTVTSAMEGLKVATPGVANLVVPISLVILVGLFIVQRFGTGAVGWMFGPVLLLWFIVIGVLGGHEVLLHPGVLQGLSPVWGVRFFFDHGLYAWLTLGSVVLCVTGAEALYADRGHFGATPIRIAWFGLVLPAVLLSYLGQGALILAHPHDTTNPFFLLVPAWGRLAMVFVATAASLIASQSVITGSFSVVRQAVQLRLLPRLRIRHTSETEGQIYVPAVNWALCTGVVLLVLVFQSSNRLTSLYGTAVTGTFILDTTLFLAVARSLWRIRIWKLAGLGALFWFVELAFFSSNLTKIPDGAWIPLCVGLAVATVMNIWRQGQEVVTRNRTEQEGPLGDLMDHLAATAPTRVPGTAIFPSPGKTTTPLALRAQVEYYNAFQARVLIVSMHPVAIPHLDPAERFVAEQLGSGRLKVTHLTVYLGYRDRQNIPEALALARKHGALERNLDLEHATYFVSHITIVPAAAGRMARLRGRFFVALARNSTSPMEQFGLPPGRTVMTGSEVLL